MATLSIRAYAKHRGVSDAAVRRAIDDGRITLLPDGQIDPEIADRQWDANTDDRFRPKTASAVPDQSNGTGISYQKSRANKELFEALLKKLEYEEKSGKLVEIAKVEMEAFAAARAARDRLLLIPDRVAPIIIGQTDMYEIKRVLREEIIRSLQNLTDFLHGGTGSGQFFIYATAEGYRPDPDLTVTEWADKNRYLSSVASSEPGKWKTERTPYLKEIIDYLSPHLCERVVFMKGAQVGGTEFENNQMGFCICNAPGPMLIANPTTETTKRTSRMRIDPAIENCPALREKIKSPRSRDSGNTMLMKEFPGGILILTGANSAVGLRSMLVRYLFLDEVDGFPDEAGTEGDPVDLAVQRTATFNNRKIFVVSTPSIKDASRIEQAFLEGDQRYYHVPCPHCGHYQVLRWCNVIFDPKNLTEAVYKCEECGETWHDYQKEQILKKGKWIASNPNANHGVGSFHLSSLYSPHGWTSWTSITREFLDSKDDPSRLQVWTNTKLAETWEDMAGTQIDPTSLMVRCEKWGPELPPQVVILTCGVDVQDNRLELELVGWGRGEESWSIDYHILYGDPSTPELWAQLDEVLSRKYQHSKDVPDLPIAATCIASGGHYTDYVINYCFARRLHGVWAIKGIGGTGKPIQPATASKSYTTKKPVYLIGVNDAKDILMRRLHLEDRSGAGVWHFPIDRQSEWFEQITNEVASKKLSKVRLIREWVPRKDGVRTEGLNCRVYTYAALRGLVRNFRLNLDLGADKLAEIKMKQPHKVAVPQTQNVQESIVASQPRGRTVRSRGIE